MKAAYVLLIVMEFIVGGGVNAVRYVHRERLIHETWLCFWRVFAWRLFCK